MDCVRPGPSRDQLPSNDKCVDRMIDSASRGFGDLKIHSHPNPVRTGLAATTRDLRVPELHRRPGSRNFSACSPTTMIESVHAQPKRLT